MSLNKDLRLFRILMGALSLCVFASLWPNWELYFSTALYPSKHALIQDFLQQALALHIGVAVSGFLILEIFPRLCCLILWLMLTVARSLSQTTLCWDLKFFFRF